MIVEWWQVKLKGKNAKDLFRRTNFDEILFDWDDTVKSKTVRVTWGRGNVVEFVIYNSKPYLTYAQRMHRYEKIEIFEDMFAFTLVRTKLGPSATEVLFSIDKFTNIPEAKGRLRSREMWFDEDTMVASLTRLDEIMGYLLEYEVADILMEY